MAGGFTLNGVDASSYSIRLLNEPGVPVLPQSRDRTARVLGRSGRIWIGSDIGERIFSLPCTFTNVSTAADLDTKARDLANVLVDTYGRPKQIKLIFDENPDLYYLVRYAGDIPVNRIGSGGTKFTLNLIADDPYAHEEEETTSATVTASPSTIPITSSSEVRTPAKICIENTGTAPVNGFTLKIYY